MGSFTAVVDMVGKLFGKIERISIRIFTRDECISH